MNSFDATCDFFSDELGETLLSAYANLGGDDSRGLTVHIPADGDDCELGELVYADQPVSREVKIGDWIVTAKDIKGLVEQLRTLMSK